MIWLTLTLKSTSTYTYTYNIYRYTYTYTYAHTYTYAYTKTHLICQGQTYITIYTYINNQILTVYLRTYTKTYTKTCTTACIYIYIEILYRHLYSPDPHFVGTFLFSLEFGAVVLAGRFEINTAEVWLCQGLVLGGQGRRAMKNRAPGAPDSFLGCD